MDKEQLGNEKLFSRKRSFTFGAYGGVDKFICTTEPRPGAVGHSILDIFDSPTNETKPLPSAPTGQKVTELFEIIEKLQGSRLDEQRCEFPPPLKLLKISGVLPLILPPKCGGYWIDPPLEKFPDARPPPSAGAAKPPGTEEILERDSHAKIYREFFRPKYHHSFTAVDPSLGPLVLSVCWEEEERHLRAILRMKECTLHGVFSISLFRQFPTAVDLAKLLYEGVTVARFEPTCYLKAPEVITTFDEHRVSHNFKFGILYQKEGQLTEEDILSNSEESRGFQQFLSVLGETVNLEGFTGFRGGLDVCHDQTGKESVFTSFCGREIMFHVSTKLPFTDGDVQQLQRKRHIGNDIVALVYQEGEVPFISDVITSHFLHCFIAVRRITTNGCDKSGGGEAFQVAVTARGDVPHFGPALPDPPIFTEGSCLREFLLTKLINAEISCYKAERFSRLEHRTRSSLLEALHSELCSQSQSMLGEDLPPPSSQSDGVRAISEGGGGFIENFKRAIRVRSHSFDTLGVPKKPVAGGSPQKPKLSHTAPAEREAESESATRLSGAAVHLSDNFASGEVKDQASSGEDV